MTTTRLSLASAAESTLAATSGEGGLDTSTITEVPGSPSSAARPCSMEMPPMASARSWPPVPRAWEIPIRFWCARTVTSWVPVPERTDHPDRSAAHHVGEAERDAVHDRRPAVGPHHHQIDLAGVLLERQFRFWSHVVAEDHHVQAQPQRLDGFGRGVVARHRDQREVQSRVLRDGHLDAGGRRGRAASLLTPPPGAAESKAGRRGLRRKWRCLVLPGAVRAQTRPGQSAILAGEGAGTQRPGPQER